MIELIKQQVVLHPSIMPQDVIKYCFQAAYGAEHLLTDIDRVRDYFLAEYEACPKNDSQVAEFIADEVCRVNLGAWKKLSLPWEWLFNLFVEAASAGKEAVCRCQEDSLMQPQIPCVADSDKRFLEYVNEWLSFVQENEQNLTFSFEDLQMYVQWYLAQCIDGKPSPVHHTTQYRSGERPSYRVISGSFVRLIPVLMELGKKGGANANLSRLKFANGGVIVIDGKAASGKTTLAAGLAAVIGASIVHMDDFFLPPELRTQLRLNEPGGNIHYERFAQEVLPYLKSGINSEALPLAKPAQVWPDTPRASFDYRIFDCTTMKYSGIRNVKVSPWVIVEGSYSSHPHFSNYMDLRVFSNTDSLTQLERITARNGAETAKIFVGKWIPMEEAYFSAYQIAETADIII